MLTSPSGARFLANAAGEPTNAQALARLLDKVAPSAGGQGHLAEALERLATAPGPDAALFRNRAAESKELSAVLEKFSVKAGASAPATVETLPLTTHGQQALLRSATETSQAVSPSGNAPPPGAPGRGPGMAPPPGAQAPRETGAVEEDASTPALKRVLSARHVDKPQAIPGEPALRRDGDKVERSREARVQAIGEDSAREPGATRAPSSSTSLEMDTRPPAAFRPGDVYSEDTLRSARICPECGFRLNSGGMCARCNEYSKRETTSVPQ